MPPADHRPTPNNRAKPRGRRRVVQPTETPDNLYKLPARTIENFMAAERRRDALDHLREVAEQKRVWRLVTGICVAVNVLFLVLAFWGETLLTPASSGETQTREIHNHADK